MMRYRIVEEHLQKLDVVLYRCHFTQSVKAAKQLISHKHVMVNNIVTNNNSYVVKKSDLIKSYFEHEMLAEKKPPNIRCL